MTIDMQPQTTTALRAELSSIAILMQERGAFSSGGGDNFALLFGDVQTYILRLEEALANELAEVEQLQLRKSGVEWERDQLFTLTHLLAEHPEDYDGPCECQTCMSYGASDVDE